MADRITLVTSGRTPKGVEAQRLQRGAIRRFATAMLFSKEIWLIYISGFLCGRASFGSDIYPFGLAFFWTIVRSGRRTHAIGAFFAVLLGMASVAPVHRLVALGAILLGGLFVAPDEETEKQRRKGTFAWRQAIVLGIAHLGTRILFAHVFEAPWESPVWIGIEAVLITSTIVLWRPLSQLWGTHFQSGISREGWASIAVFSVMLSLGLRGVQIGPIMPSEVWNSLITLMGALIGGGAGGAAVGAALGWVTNMGGLAPFGGTNMYALPGLIGGLLAPRGKLWVGMGFFFGHLLLSVQLASADEIVLSLIHAFVGLACFALLPAQWSRALERLVPGSRARERFMQVREERLKEAVSERLMKLGQLLSEMGRTFSVVEHGKDEFEPSSIEVDDVIEEVTAQLCETCPGFRSCWEQNLYETYKDVVAFLKTSEAKGILKESNMPLKLRERCFRTGQLTQTAHGVISVFEERMRWQQRLTGQRELIPLQLKGIASLVEGLAEQVRIETGRSDEIQVMLTDAFREARVEVDLVEVRPLGTSQRYEILVERSSPCDRIGLWKEQVGAAVDLTLTTVHTVWKEECTEAGPCRLWFTARPVYSLDKASVSIAKEKGSVSGDTLSAIDLVDGRVAMILSDGMGTGPQAAVQSQSAVKLLGSLLTTGFDLRSAVRSVNALLLMRTVEETYATIDAVVIDQFSGMAQFLKVGSAPTFIKRESEIDIIRSASIPVGIVQQMDVRIQHRQLRPGDTILLATDGLLDSVDRGAEQEEWIARVLQREEHTTPQGLLDATIKRVSEAAGGVWYDDVTMAVIRLAERPRGGEPELIPEYRRVGATG